MIFISSFAQRQQASDNFCKIKGRLFDSSSHTPLQYATISLFTPAGKNPVNGAISDGKGNFVIDSLQPGTYMLVAEFLGYKSVTVNNIVLNTQHHAVQLRDIKLSPAATTLQNISITARGKLIENKIDKMVFNAERDLTSQSGVATDVLKKIPQVSVDVDGNVELAGSSDIRFLINGKPSSAFGTNIADVLQSIPASQIKSIEVITNPGAKYDAQGLGGIINIILKNNQAHGVNGSLSLTAGTRMENGSFNFSEKQGKFGMNAFVSGNVRVRANTLSSSDRTTYDTSDKNNLLLRQGGVTRFERAGYQSGMGFNYDVNDHNSLSANISYLFQ